MRFELDDNTQSHDLRRKQWLKTNKLRYKKKKLLQQILGTKRSNLKPPEILRKIIKDHGDLSTARHRADKSIHMAALKYLPRAIYRVFEMMPQPFELQRDVNVLYHNTGAITFIEGKSNVIPQVYIAQWASSWVRMRQEKFARKKFLRTTIPAFSNEEPFFDYGDSLNVISNESTPVVLDLDPVEDEPVIDWLYDGFQPLKNDPDTVNGPSYKKYTLTVPQMSALYRLSRQFIHNTDGAHYASDPNLLYMFNRDAFITAKSLGYAVPSGPSFEPLFPKEDDNNDSWTEFNDINKLIIRRPIATDYRIALPYVYNNNPRSIAFQVAQYPLSCVVLDGDDVAVNTTAPFSVDRSFNPPAHSSGQLGFNRINHVRQVAAAKHSSNMTFLQAFSHHQATTQIEYLKEKLESCPKLIQQTCGEEFYTTIRDKIRQGEDILNVRMEKMTPPIDLNEDSLSMYGSTYFEYQTPSYSRYLSNNPSYYSAEFMVTTSHTSPYYNQKGYKIDELNVMTDVNDYLYPNGDKSLWNEDLLGGDVSNNDGDYNLYTDLKNCQKTLENLTKPTNYDASIIIADADFDLEPMFSNFNLYEQTDEVNTLAGLMLYHAPAPFNTNHGSTVPIHKIDLIKNWYMKTPVSPTAPLKLRLSHQKLIKKTLLTQIHGHKSRKNRFTTGNNAILKILARQMIFDRTKIDWLEAATQVVRQGYNMLNLIVKRKRVEYLHLDYNFTLQATRVLTTKERKHSRFGNSFHLICQILRLLKLITDLHIKHRLGDIDAFQLADAIQYTFNHVGILTQMYRYKYHVTHQIRQCKDIKHVVYAKFNQNLQKGHGVGFWQPSWRVWVYFLQGMTPLLEKWLGNLLSRHFEGRQYGEVAKSITKQRVEAVYDSELKKRVHRDIMDMMPIELRATKTRVIDQHLTEAWRCWRSGRPWNVPGMPAEINAMILQFVKSKADHWVTHAYRIRERLKRGDFLEKTVVKKNLGRLSRLALKQEGERQASYLTEGPNVSTNEASTMLTMMSHWLESRSFVPIRAPPINYKHDNKILTLSLDKLKEGYLNNTTNKLSVAQRYELTLVQQGHDNVEETLKRIKSMILTARNFKEIEIEFYDEYNVLTPVYTVDAMEKITDMYLDQYLWYEAHRRGLFPEWIKPSDREPGPHLVYKTCSNINNYKGIWDNTDGGAAVLVQTQFSKLYDNIDLTVLNRLLALIMDPVLADYITARYNTKITYKDMTHVNSIGIIRGLAFSSFVTQYYGLMIDLIILGLERASQLAGPPAAMNLYGQFNQCGNTLEEVQNIEQSHPVRMYCRYLDKVYILFKLDGEEVTDIITDHLALYPDPHNNNIHSYASKTCWPRDARMRLMRNDVNLGKAVFYHIKNRLPLSLTTIDWANSFVSVYSKDNPQLLFDMLGFEVRLIPLYREVAEYTTFSLRTSTWSIRDRYSKENTAAAYVRVSDQHIEGFVNQIRHMLMTSGNAPYIKIAQKWNSIITSLMTYYREAVASTPELLEAVVKAENKVQNRIKSALNSKMPNRFPPVVFYSPVELGGLGMLSMGNILVPQSDRIYGKETTQAGITHFTNGMNSGDHAIPALYRYINTWETEFDQSEKAWADYQQKAEEAKNQERRLGLSDLSQILDQGVPRINTLFSKDRQTLWYDKGWRTRLEWKKYTTTFHNNYWWTNPRHDGRLWSLNNYRTDVVQALGGVESILEHTLFKATYFKTWEGVFWEKKTSFEDSLKLTRLTKAQSQGLSQVPNRRFALWWSPTINRADVYIGFMVQLDITGIFMFGKLPVLKVAYIQIFRGHLWQKIHESIVLDLCTALEQQKDKLDIETVEKESIHARKSYNMQTSCADIKLTSRYKWDYTIPTVYTIPEEQRKSSQAQQDTYWLDIQLRWGDYDQHDIELYTRGKYLAYTADQVNNIYPSQAGAVVAIDLTYNTWSAYGNFFPGLTSILQKTMSKILKSNSALYILRERVRKAVQLYTSEPTEPFLSSSNYGEIFRPGNAKGHNVTWFIDSAAVYRVITHRTVEGNNTTKPINGALIIFNPTSGTLYLKIIHTSAWTAQKRLTQMAKWKSAEETVALIRPLPQEERPTSLIIAQQSLLDPLQSMCTDYPNMVLKGSDLSLPLQSILKMKRVGDQVIQATEPRIVIYNLYDNWMQTTTQSFTCFSRLLLILRALHINEQRTHAILTPNASVTTAPSHLWPTLTDMEWANVENQLRDLILADFAIKNNVNVQSLTQTETRDIILGAKITSPTEQREQLLKELDSANNNNNNNSDVITTSYVQTKDQYGNIVVTASSSNYEKTKFISSDDWRVRYLSSQSLHRRTTNVAIRQPNNSSMGKAVNNTAFLLPTTLFNQFVAISDIKTHTMAYMYGEVPVVDGQVINNSRLIKALVVPPQHGTAGSILFSHPPCHTPGVDSLNGDSSAQQQLLQLPVETTHAMKKNAQLLSRFVPIGIIYTIGHDDGQYLSPELCVRHNQWFQFIKENNNVAYYNQQNNQQNQSSANQLIQHNLEDIDKLQMNQTITLTISFTAGSCSLYAFSITPQGEKWYKTSPQAKLDPHGVILSTSDYNSDYFSSSDLRLSKNTDCMIYSPFTQVWNYSFMALKFKSTLPYLITLAPPIGYYHHLHRKSHFLSFVKFGQQQQLQQLSGGGQCNNQDMNDALAFDGGLNELDD